MVLLIVIVIVAALCAVSAVFYRASRGVDLWQRLAGSAHGASMALVILYGLVIDEAGLTGTSNLLQLPAVLLLLVLAASFVYSCWLFRRRWPYLLLHLLAIVLLMPTLYWIGIALVGWT